MENILLATIGLPRSGKSTFCKTTGYPIVNPDAIRLALHGQDFVIEAEPMVWAIAKYMVNALFLSGHQVVLLDATNISRRRRDEWKSKNYKIKYVIFDTPKEICIERAKKDGRDYLIAVIERMSKEFSLDGIDPSDIIEDKYRKDITI